MQAVLVVFLLMAIVLDVSLLVFANTRQDYSRSIYFAFFCTAVLLYTLGYLVEIMSNTAEGATAALMVENAGIPLVAPLFLLFSLSLFKRQTLRRWMLPAVLVYGFLMFLCVLLNGWHHLYYTSIEMVYNGSAYFLKLGRGPLYLVQQLVSNAMMVVTYVLLLRRFVVGGSKLRAQMTFIVIGSLLVFAANILNFSGVLPTGLDPTPFAMSAALALFVADLSRYRMLDLSAFASSTAIETMDDAFVVLDNDWCFVSCNRRAKALFPALAGYQGTEPVVRAPGWPQVLGPARVGGQVTFERAAPGGGSVSYRANISRIISAGERRQIGWSVVVRDVTDMVSLMDQLEELAVTDPLTGIYNRRQFLLMVEREFRLRERHQLELSLIMFDLDHFKEVNDKHGHMAGDHVLREMVDTVRGQLRPYDIFARYGGEEFVVFTTADGESGPGEFAARLCRTIGGADIRFEGAHIPLTASFGAVHIPRGATFKDAMHAADDALYAAKNEGRNTVVVGEMA